MTIVDGCSVAMGFLAFDVDTVMYSIIALLVIGYVVNSMQIGVTSSRNLMIISPKNDLIKNYISMEADRGVTEIPVTGGFSGEQQTMLMTTVSRQEVPRLEKIFKKSTKQPLSLLCLPHKLWDVVSALKILQA